MNQYDFAYWIAAALAVVMLVWILFSVWKQQHNIKSDNNSQNVLTATGEFKFKAVVQKPGFISGLVLIGALILIGVLGKYFLKQKDALAIISFVIILAGLISGYITTPLRLRKLQNMGNAEGTKAAGQLRLLKRVQRSPGMIIIIAVMAIYAAAFFMRIIHWIMARI